MADDLDRCMQLAAPLLVDFHEIWRHAIAQLKLFPAGAVAEWDETTVANVIRAHALTEVKRRFDGRKGFKLIELQRLSLLLHEDKTLWRFKRVDEAGQHRNIPTLQQLELDNQIPLPGLPKEAVRLTSGYQLDAAGSDIERVIIARPMGASIAWAAQVNVIAGAASWVDITPTRLPGTERIDFRRRGK